MKKLKKYIALALMLALMIVSVGCGSEKQDTDPETDETVGGGAGANTDPDMKKEKPVYYIAGTLVVLSADGNTSEIIIPSVMNLSEESVEGFLQDFLLDGTAVNWQVAENIPLDTYNPDTISFPLEPSTGRSLTVVLEADLFAYSELTMQASIHFSDGREPIPLSATYQISELERPKETVESTSDSDDPLAAGLAAYREIVTHADTYDYNYEEAYVETGSPTGDYHYALVLVQPHHDVPALLVKQDGDTGLNIVKVFQYSPQTGTIFEVQGLIPEGVDNLDRHMSLYVPTDQRSIIYNEYYGGSGHGSTRRYTFGSGGFEDDPKLFLQSSGLWSSVDSGSKTDTSVEETGRVEIEWYDITDMTGLDTGKPTGE